MGMGKVKKGMEEVTPSYSSSHGEWEGLLVELETWIFPLTLNWGWPDLGSPPVLSQANFQHLLQTGRPWDSGWYTQCPSIRAI